MNLVQFLACCQHVRVWLIALARSKLVKENDPEEKPQDFPSAQKLAIDYTRY
jgi:hypothetical protein